MFAKLFGFLDVYTVIDIVENCMASIFHQLEAMIRIIYACSFLQIFKRQLAAITLEATGSDCKTIEAPTSEIVANFPILISGLEPCYN